MQNPSNFLLSQVRKMQYSGAASDVTDGPDDQETGIGTEVYWAAIRETETLDQAQMYVKFMSKKSPRRSEG